MIYQALLNAAPEAESAVCQQPDWFSLKKVRLPFYVYISRTYIE